MTYSTQRFFIIPESYNQSNTIFIKKSLSENQTLCSKIPNNLILILLKHKLNHDLKISWVKHGSSFLKIFVSYRNANT